MYKIVFSLVWVVLTGCSILGTKSSAPEEVNTNPKVTHRYDVPKPAKREPGSLWSEDSRWNTVYSSSSSRMIGDNITLKVNEPFKDRIAMAMNVNKKPEPSKVNNDSKSDSKNESKESSREPASANAATAKKDDTATVEATILEVLPNGSYRVGVNRAFKIGREQPYVVMEGVLREREISSDDSASTDSLMNLKLETFDEQKHTMQSNSKPAEENPNNKK